MSELPADYENAVDVPALRAKIALVLYGTAGDSVTRPLLSEANQALARFDQPQAPAEIIPLIDTLAVMMAHAGRSISIREWEIAARVLNDAEAVVRILARLEPGEPL